MDDLPVEYGVATQRPTSQRADANPAPLSDCTVLRHFPNHIAFDAIDLSIIGLAKPRGVFRHNIEYGLNIGRRAGDDAQDLTRRSLLLQRFFEFLEQPDILDGDDRLVGEGFEQGDLGRGEGTNLDATRRQYPNEFTLLTKRNA